MFSDILQVYSRMFSGCSQHALRMFSWYFGDTTCESGEPFGTCECWWPSGPGGSSGSDGSCRSGWSGGLTVSQVAATSPSTAIIHNGEVREEKEGFMKPRVLVPQIDDLLQMIGSSWYKMQLVVLLCHDILNVFGSRMSRKCFLCVSDKNKELFIFQIKSIQKELFEKKKEQNGMVW